MSASEERAERCERCRFSDPRYLIIDRTGERDEDYEDVTHCHRFPPNVAAKDAEDCAEWPLVRLDDWCGEFQPKAKPAVDKRWVDFLQSCSARLRKAIVKEGIREFQGRTRIRGLGCKSFNDLLEKNAADVLDVHNFGAGSLKELREKLAALGLKLKGD